MIKKINFFLQETPLIIVVLVFIFSGFCASLSAALVRLSSQDLHPFQIAFIRSFLVIPIVIPFVYKNSFSIIKTNKPFYTFLRSLSGSGAMLLFFYGISMTELSKAQSLAFTIPIFATLLAILTFKEVVGVRRWSAMGLGFFGVLIVLRPDLEISFGPICVLLACLLWSISLLLAKKLTETDNNVSITFWQSAGVIPLSFIAALFVWDWFNIQQLILLCLLTLVATLAQLTLNFSLKRGEISFLLPLDYLRLLWAVWLGYIIFGEVPLQNIWIGGSIIVAATTYISIRENYILNLNKTKDRQKINKQNNLNI